MANAADLRVKISGDYAEIRRGIGLLRGDFAALKIQAAASSPNMAGWSKGLSGIRQQVLDVAAAYISWRAIGGIVRGVFDSFDKMDRIDELGQTVALSAEDLSKFAFAAKFSNVELEALGKGFSFFQRNLSKNGELLGKLGVDAPDLIGKLRQVMDIFKQLPDGPEKATLAAELFGSRLGGNLIPLLNEGADGFDRLSETAENTGNVFDEAAVKGAAKFNDNMDILKGTLAGVFNVTAQQLAPAIAAYAGTANDAAQETNAAAQGGKFLATVFKVVATGGIIVKNVIEAVAGVLGFLADVAIENGKIIITSIGGAFTTVGNTMKAFLSGGPVAAFATFTAQVKQNGAAIMGATRSAQNNLRGSWDAMRAGFKDASSDIANAFVGAFAEVDAAGASAKKAIGEVGGEADAASKKGEALRKVLAAMFGEGAGKDGKGKEKAKAVIAGLVDQGALALDQVDRDLSALEQRYEDGQVKLADYFAQRQALELQQIDLKLAAAEADAAAAKSTDEQSRALTEIIKLQRDRGEIGPRVAREQAKAEKEAAAATLETLRDKQAAIQEELRGGTDYLSAQEMVGGIGPVDAERQLFDLRQRSLEQLRALRQAFVAYLAAQAAGSPEHAAAVAGLQQLDTELAQVQASQQTFANRVKDSFYQSLLNGFETVRQVYEETGSVLKAATAGVLDFARTFITALNRMAAEALAKNIMGALFKGGDSKEGGAGGGLMSIFTSWLGKWFGGGSAKGNVFGSQGVQAFANGGAFTNQLFSVPTFFQFGKGGQFGVMGEAGDEAVMPLTRGPGGRLGVEAHGAGAAGRVTTPIVVIGDRAVADAMASTAGRDVVITHVLASIDKIRSAL